MIPAGSLSDNLNDPTPQPSPASPTELDLGQELSPSQCCQPAITTPALSVFEQNLAQASLPPPGPLHYNARRELWLTQTTGPPLPPVPSTSRQRLEQLLSIPGAVHSEEVWKAGVERVWKGLVTGGRLKRRLPMNLVIKIIHAGWLRDPETWPADAVALEPDDILEDSTILQQISRVPTEYSSSLTTPWRASNAIAEDGTEDGSRQVSGIVGVGP